MSADEKLSSESEQSSDEALQQLLVSITNDLHRSDVIDTERRSEYLGLIREVTEK